MTTNPATWPADEVERYFGYNRELRDLAPKSASGDRAVVVGSTGPFAQLAGRKALEAGGTAVDAAMTTAIAQIALAYGSWVSYGGIISVVHYEAATGEVTSMSGGYRTFREETDPATIPAAPAPSGRTAMTPGFFAGVRAVHERFGTLPWADLFAPAIFVAEHGLPVGDTAAAHFKMRAELLARTPEGREAFPKIPSSGDTLVQAALAKTLRAVAQHGTDYIYTGPWAQKFVEIVRREGGKPTLEDLRDYEVVWSDPLRSTVNGYEVCALGAPDTGGAALIEGLNLLEEAGLGDPTTDPEALFWFVQIARQNHMLTSAPPALRADRTTAKRLWERMRDNGRFVAPRVARELFATGTHSDFTAAADEAGNVVAVCHSINTSLWGTTGIFVDGISIPDSAAFQQGVLAQTGPGNPLPNPTNPAIVLKDGKPFLASSSIGSGLLEVTLQCVSSVLRGGLSADEAVRRPFFHGPDYVSGDSITSEVRRDANAGSSPGGGTTSAPEQRRTGVQALMDAERESGTDPADIYPNVLAKVPQVVQSGFDAAVLDGVRDLGQPLTEVPVEEGTLPRGYWVGVQIDQATGRKTAAHTGFVNGRAEAL